LIYHRSLIVVALIVPALFSACSESFSRALSCHQLGKSAKAVPGARASSPHRERFSVVPELANNGEQRRGGSWSAGAPPASASDSELCDAQLSFKITVFGAVSKPGTYDVQLDTTISQAIEKAGGFRDDADKNMVTVKSKYERHDYSLERGQGGVALKDGDTLMVHSLRLRQLRQFQEYMGPAGDFGSPEGSHVQFVPKHEEKRVKSRIELIVQADFARTNATARHLPSGLKCLAMRSSWTPRPRSGRS
jgi:hypothetical protein